MQKAIGYIRVSTQEQATEGVSLEAQKAKIKAYATIKGLDLVDVILDAGESGKDLKRPGISLALSYCQQKQVKHFIVCKLDRLTRSTRDLLELVESTFKRNGIQFHSIQETIDTTTAQGRFFLTIMGAMAQMERELLAERTKDALAHKREMLETTGTVPHGYRLSSDGVHIERADNYEMLNLVVSLRSRGCSLQKIARHLEQAGYVNQHGHRYHHKSITSMLRRAEYDEILETQAQGVAC